MQNLRTTAIIGASLLFAGHAFAQDAETPAADAAEAPVFADAIYPLIKESCVKCHRPEYTDERGRARRPKADLVMSTKEGLMAGGENGEIIVAGNADESSLLTTTMLPIDHDEHMPPEDKAPQWTDEQKELVRAWINAGADFGEWTEDPNPVAE